MIQRWTMIVTYHPTPVVFLSPFFEGLLPELGFVRKLRTSKLPWFVALDFFGAIPHSQTWHSSVACFAVGSIEVFTASAGALTTEEGSLQLRHLGCIAGVAQDDPSESVRDQKKQNKNIYEYLRQKKLEPLWASHIYGLSDLDLKPNISVVYAAFWTGTSRP